MRARLLGLCMMLLVCSIVSAQNSADHPVVGRFDGSQIVHQEISRFGEYEIAVSAENTESVQGEVWMTLYDAPSDSSTFSVYSTYVAFLEAEGFEILVNYRPGESPANLLEEVYFREPFADDGNFAHPAPFTNGSDAQSAYLAARRDDGVYVSIAIAAGWSAYPQYKLDVVQAGENTQRITVEGPNARGFEDHPVVGRFNRSAIDHQEISSFGEYRMTVGADEIQPIQGEVWMTLYSGPGDSSTFSVYATYLDFLEAEGFEIIESCKPGECRGRLLSDVYGQAPFADNGNFAHPAPFTNGSDVKSGYIAARKDDVLYVSIAIAAGWASYPQYKVDVVETKSDSGSITSTGVSTRQETEPDAEGLDGTPAAGMPQTQATPGESGGVLERFFTGNGAIDVRGGIAGYMLLDPSIAGGLVVTESGGPPSVQAEGFKNLYGPWVRASWFPNETVGIGVEAAFIESDEQFTVEDTLYRSQAELQFFQAVALVRLVGSEYPATLTMALGGGAALIELQQSTESVASTYSSVVDILGVIGTSVDMSIPIVRFVHVTGGLSYLFVPFTTLTLSDNDGTYARTYHEGNLGGLEIRLGVVLEL